MDPQERGANDYWVGQNISRVLGIIQQTTVKEVLGSGDNQDLGGMRERYVQAWVPEMIELVKGVLKVGQHMNMDSMTLVRDRGNANGQAAPQDDQGNAGVRHSVGAPLDRPSGPLPGGKAPGGTPQP